MGSTRNLLESVVVVTVVAVAVAVAVVESADVVEAHKRTAVVGWSCNVAEWAVRFVDTHTMADSYSVVVESVFVVATRLTAVLKLASFLILETNYYRPMCHKLRTQEANTEPKLSFFSLFFFYFS